MADAIGVLLRQFSGAPVFKADTREFTGTFAGSGSYLHTPTVVDVPAIAVGIVWGGASPTGAIATYGGVPMQLVTFGENPGGEAGAAVIFFLANPPSGAQTVFADWDTTPNFAFTTYTLSGGGGNLKAYAALVISDSQLANPRSQLTGRSNHWSMCAAFSGTSAVTAMTALDGWTKDQEHDFGISTAGTFSKDFIDSGSTITGYQATSDDVILCSIGVYSAQTRLIPTGIEPVVGGRIMSSLARHGGLTHHGGIAGARGGLAS